MKTLHACQFPTAHTTQNEFHLEANQYEGSIMCGICLTPRLPDNEACVHSSIQSDFPVMNSATYYPTISLNAHHGRETFCQPVLCFSLPSKSCSSKEYRGGDEMITGIES